MEGTTKIKKPPVIKLTTPVLEGCVVQLEHVGDYTDWLYPQELELIKKASRARRIEFSTGRYVSRYLLTDMGLNEYPILQDQSGCPLWPFGVKGSISHKNLICLVAMTQSDSYRSLGADIEVVEPIDQAVWKVFTSEAELADLTLLGVSEVEAINIIFSVKEALYKCAYPLFGNATSSFVQEKISYSLVDSSLLEAACFYKSMMFKVIVGFGFKIVLSVAYV